MLVFDFLSSGLEECCDSDVLKVLSEAFLKSERSGDKKKRYVEILEKKPEEAPKGVNEGNNNDLEELFKNRHVDDFSKYMSGHELSLSAEELDRLGVPSKFKEEFVSIPSKVKRKLEYVLSLKYECKSGDKYVFEGKEVDSLSGEGGFCRLSVEVKVEDLSSLLKDLEESTSVVFSLIDTAYRELPLLERRGVISRSSWELNGDKAHVVIAIVPEITEEQNKEGARSLASCRNCS